MAVYVCRNLKEIPIPPSGHINHHDGRVSVFWMDSGGRRRKTVIGRAASETTMQPNTNFRIYFPALWEEHYGEIVGMPQMLCCGPYAMALAINEKTGLYTDVHESFGTGSGNALMDYALFDLEEPGKLPAVFEDVMRDRLCLSRARRTEKAMESFFSAIGEGEGVGRFRDAWLRRCAEGGTGRAWIYAGSIGRCDGMSGSFPGRREGCSKERSGAPAWMAAVRLADGRPVSWMTAPGGITAPGELDAFVRKLEEAGFEVEGIVLGRGLASREAMNAVRDCGMCCIAELPSGSVGFQEMMNRHAGRIGWNAGCVVRGGAAFGAAVRTRAFVPDGEESCCALFLELQGGTERMAEVVARVWDAVDAVKGKLPAPVEELTLPPDMKRFIDLRIEDGAAVAAGFNHVAWQRAIDESAFRAVACSEEFSADDAWRILGFGECVRRQFTLVRMKEGRGTPCEGAGPAAEGRLAACFIAAVMRNETDRACRRIGLKEARVLEKLREVRIIAGEDGRRTLVDVRDEGLEALLGAFGLKREHFVRIAEELGLEGAEPVPEQVRKLPGIDVLPKKKGGRPRKEPDAEAKPKGKPGRPRGSRNRSTLAREAGEAEKAAEASGVAEAQAAAEGAPERNAGEMPGPGNGKGRPKDSRNLKTIERPAGAAADHEAAKTRGRPGKDSRIIRSEGEEAVPRRRGRPKGSRNRKTLEREAMEAMAKRRAAQGEPPGGDPGKDGDSG